MQYAFALAFGLIRPMKIHLLILATIVLAGCAAPSGATNSTINGIDIWRNGTPSQPYHVIATVQRVAADSSTNYNQQIADIAAEARQRGADGVIVLNTVMVVSRMDLTMGRAIMAPKVTAELIKYD